MSVKNIIYLFFLLCFYACQEVESNQTPVNTIEIPSENPKLSHLTSFEDFETIIAAEKGNIILVNIWATWCKPCVYEMPSLEKLHKKYEHKGFKVIALSLDEVSKVDSLVIPFWEEKNFSMDNYLIATTDPGAFVNKIDPLWIGLIPTSFIFNTNGDKVETITGAMTFESFEKKLLAVSNAVN